MRRGTLPGPAEANVFVVGCGDDGVVFVVVGGGVVGVVVVVVVAVGRGQNLLVAAWNSSWPAQQRGECLCGRWW